MGGSFTKILHVCSAPYITGGGISEYVRNISERLARKHEVTVFASNLTGKLPRFEEINGVTVVRFRCYAPSKAYMLSVELPIMLSKVKFDVVHAHNYHAFPIHVAAALAKHSKFVVSPCFHGSGHTPFRDCIIRVLKPFGKRTLKKADQILAASEYERFLLCQQFGFRSDEIAVIPRGVDFSEFKGLKRRKRKFKSILFVGRLRNYKGVQYLVEALPKLPDDVTLQIVGKGPLRSSLAARAKRLKVFDRIRFYQFLKRRELLQMYADSDVFVLPSRYEAYSKVVAEALMTGTPCIVTNASALKEWIDNESCFGIDFPVDINKLAKSIASVIECDLNKKSIQRAREKWIGTKIIDWNDVVSKLEEVYNN
jgi:glycosyltransferase involved in cell wall biosynthesis